MMYSQADKREREREKALTATFDCLQCITSSYPSTLIYSTLYTHIYTHVMHIIVCITVSTVPRMLLHG